jgi:hypothetical protein
LFPIQFDGADVLTDKHLPYYTGLHLLFPPDNACEYAECWYQAGIFRIGALFSDSFFLFHLTTTGTSFPDMFRNVQGNESIDSVRYAADRLVESHDDIQATCTPNLPAISMTQTPTARFQLLRVAKDQARRD